MNYSTDIKFSNNLIKNKTTYISYSGDLFKKNSSSVYIIYGFGDNWAHTAEQQMERNEKGFVAKIHVLDSDKLNFCFRNQNNEWDNNYGSNYASPITEDNNYEESFIINEDEIENIIDNIFNENIFNESTNESTEIIKSNENIVNVKYIENTENNVNVENIENNKDIVKNESIENIEIVEDNKNTDDIEINFENITDNAAIDLYKEDSFKTEENNNVMEVDTIIENICNEIDDDIVEESDEVEFRDNFEAILESEIKDEPIIEEIEVEESGAEESELNIIDNFVSEAVTTDVDATSPTKDFDEIEFEDNSTSEIKTEEINEVDTNIKENIEENMNFENNSEPSLKEEPINNKPNFNLDSLIQEILSPITSPSSFEEENLESYKTRTTNISYNNSDSNELENDNKVDTIISSYLTDLYKNIKPTEEIKNSFENTSESIKEDTVENNIVENIKENIDEITDESTDVTNKFEQIKELDLDSFSELQEDTLDNNNHIEESLIENAIKEHNQVENMEEIVEENLIEEYEENSDKPQERSLIVSPRHLSPFYKTKKRIKLAFMKVFSIIPRLLSGKFNEDR